MIKSPCGMSATIRDGPGEGVLWIHGYTMDSRIWRRLWDLLPDWCHVGIDLPGHGASLPMPDDLDLPRLGRCLGDFAQEQDLHHLVGLSFGGMVALQAAIERPDVFRTLVLGAPALAGGPQDRYAQARNLELLAAYRARGAGPWLGRIWMSPGPAIFEGVARQPHLQRELAAIIADHSWAELATGGMQRLTCHPQTAEALRRITADTLVLVGSEDTEAFRRSAELIRRAIPACHRVHLDGIGHLTLLESPETLWALLDTHFRVAAAPSAQTEGRMAYGWDR